jgi:hypothetical protein
MPHEKRDSENAPGPAREVGRLIGAKGDKWTADPLRDRDPLPNYPRVGKQGQRLGQSLKSSDRFKTTTTKPMRRFWRAAWATGTLLLSTQIPIGAAEPSGQVASHGLERDAVNADGTGEGAGYFTFIQGIVGSLFSGQPSEATAFFTFKTEQFSTGVISNGSVVAVLHPPGRFTIYLNTTPSGNWNDFTTFAQGQAIAIVEFGTTQDINTGSAQIGYTSAEIIQSSSFDFRGQRYNLRDLFPHGFTIAFNTNPTPINNSFPLIFCLGFTSFTIGSDAGQTD